MYIHVVNESTKTIKTIAKQAMKGNWMKMAWIVAIYTTFTVGLTSIVSNFTMKDFKIPIFGTDTYLTYNYSFIGDLFRIIIIGPFIIGLVAAALSFLRTRKAETKLVFSGFENFFKAVWLYLLMSIKIVLWTFLFIIPGFIAAFRYSQAFCIYRDHPEFTALECIRESSRIMTGNKGKYFVLLLSFIGWYILAGIPDYALWLLVQDHFVKQGSVMFYALDVIGYIPYIFLIAYMRVSQSVFYDLLTERLVPSRPEDRMNQNNNYEMN